MRHMFVEYSASGRARACEDDRVVSSCSMLILEITQYDLFEANNPQCKIAHENYISDSIVLHNYLWFWYLTQATHPRIYLPDYRELNVHVAAHYLYVLPG